MYIGWTPQMGLSRHLRDIRYLRIRSDTREWIPSVDGGRVYLPVVVGGGTNPSIWCTSLLLKKGVLPREDELT